MSEDKKKMYYYYGGKERKAGEIKKSSQEEVAPYPFGDIDRDFDRMIDRFQREFDSFWGRSPMRSRMRAMMPFGEAKWPSVDLEDQGKTYRLTVDLPGFSKENVDIEVSDDAVTINAKKAQSTEDKNKNYVRRERAAQTYYRRILLPESVKSDDAKASLNNGTLEVVLSKKEPKETKKLTIA